MKTDKLPDFASKVLSIGIAGSDEAASMAKAQFKVIGDRLFLVGIVPKKGSGSDWVEGVECAVAWDTVTDYLVFESQAQYEERLKMVDNDNEEE